MITHYRNNSASADWLREMREMAAEEHKPTPPPVPVSDICRTCGAVVPSNPYRDPADHGCIRCGGI